MSRDNILSFASESVNCGRFRDYFGQLVEVPTVSSLPERRDDIRKGAELVKQLLNETGASAELIETAGNPVVYGAIGDPSKNPIVIYGHYDVQPAALDDGWRKDPFTLTEKGENFYGRGTADQKGPFAASLEGVRLALAEGIHDNYVFIVEGEEEMGSRNFGEAVRKLSGKVKPRAALVPDTGWLSEDVPAVTYGLRGLVYMHWTYEAAKNDGHSGHVGGVADNPIDALIHARACCTDSKTGRILIPGLYDGVRPLTLEEEAEWQELPISPEQFQEENGLYRMRTGDKIEMLARTWALPAMDSHGLAGGYNQWGGKKTVMPAKGQLLVSIRIVPDQEPGEVLKKVESYLKKQNPFIKVEPVSLAFPYLGDVAGEHTLAMVDAMEYSFGRRPVRIRSGGSIGAVTDMIEAFGSMPIVMPGVEKPSYSIHGLNEHYGKDMAIGIITSMYCYLEQAAKAKK